MMAFRIPENPRAAYGGTAPIQRSVRAGLSGETSRLTPGDSTGLRGSTLTVNLTIAGDGDALTTMYVMEGGGVGSAQVGYGPGALRTLFRWLVSKWLDETAFTSSLSEMIDHPAYQAIIRLGRPAVPLLLEELKTRPDHWFWALHALTGLDPTTPDAAFDEAVEQWLAWGREQGLIA